MNAAVDDTNRRFERIRADLERNLPETPEVDDFLLGEALAVADAESKRKDSIESKATTYVVAVAIAIALVSGLPAMFRAADWPLPLWAAILLVVLHALTIVHFLLAAYYAIRTRQSRGFAVPLITDVLELAAEGAKQKRRRAVLALSRAKFNEPILTLKSNDLAVAEDLFQRALLLLVVASLSVVVVRLLGAGGYL